MTTESQPKGSKEEVMVEIDQWIKTMSETGEVGEISAETLKIALEEYGANFELGEAEKRSLAKKTNISRADGMKAVWGEKWQEYKLWTKEEVVQKYETESFPDKPLPALGPDSDKSIKYSGMRHFLGHLTAYAVGAVDFETFKLYLEARMQNGFAWRDGGEKVKIDDGLIKDKARIPTSIPPGFLQMAWEWLKLNQTAQIDFES